MPKAEIISIMIPRDLDGNMECDELHTVLAMGCTKFILAAMPG